MGAKNMNQLKNMLKKEMRKGMMVTADKALADMYEETAGFYTGGEPKMYKRTGTLGDSPNVTAITEIDTGDSVQMSMKAYLDTSGNYTSGSKPSLVDVFTVANSGVGTSKLRPTVGRQGFWDRAEEKVEQDFKNTMKKIF